MVDGADPVAKGRREVGIHFGSGVKGVGGVRGDEEIKFSEGSSWLRSTLLRNRFWTYVKFWGLHRGQRWGCGDRNRQKSIIQGKNKGDGGSIGRGGQEWYGIVMEGDKQ